MTNKFKVIGLDHVNVTTPEELEKEVVEWYESCLGLERLDKPAGTSVSGAWFQAGDQQVHISIDEHNPPKQAHFSLVVTDFNGVIECMRDAGCHIEQAREIPGRHRFFTRDPAGNRIEIMSLDGARS